MVLQVIPAIDISQGRVVRFADGQPVAVDDAPDPLALARSFAEAGASILHVVDVDLAFTGEARNLGLITEMSAMGLTVQASGGVRDARGVSAMLRAGASRVVLGSAALADMDEVTRAVGQFGSKVVIGLELDGSEIRSRGRDEVRLRLAPTLDVLTDLDVARFLVTAVRNVGALSGPDLEASAPIAATGIPWIVAGGVSSLADLKAVAEAGAEGAVIGRAAVEGGLDIALAIAAFSADAGSSA